jgi:transposase
MNRTKQQQYTMEEFNGRYPNDDACLQDIFNRKFSHLAKCPKCGKSFKYYRVRERKCYACQYCANQLFPLANTIFEKSVTSLRSWYYAIFLFSVSKNGVSAKELQRQLGVTYKCAWRMANKIRNLFQDDENTLGNTVELDETFFGGKAENMHQEQKAKLGGPGTSGKTPVFGAVERGGKIVAIKVQNVDQGTLLPHIDRYITPESMVYTDEMGAYAPLTKRGYKHEVVKHSGHEYVRGNVHTNTIEGFWSQLKRSINGTYHYVSPKYLQEYVNEFSYRYNQRNSSSPVFPLLLGRV